MHLVDRLRGTIRRFGLAQPATRVVAAVSGGSDSVATACLLRELHLAGDLRLVALAHFNHQLRPAAADEEQFCRDFAASLRLPIFVERGDVGHRARRERRSIEDAARTSRYEFFERARSHFSADVVALGHTRDDQAETFLLRLLRGAGSRGLAAMHPSFGAVIRPALECRRHELRAYLDAQQIAFVSDESNADVSIPRNRVRAELLPVLETRFNPSIVEVLADAAEIARGEWLFVDAASDAEAGIWRAEPDGSWHVDPGRLLAAPLAVARHLTHRVLMAAADGRPVTFPHVEAVLGLARFGGGPIDLPGATAQRIGSDVVLQRRAVARRWTAGRPVNLFRYRLSIPGEVHVAEASVLVRATRGMAAGALAGRANLSSLSAAVVAVDPALEPLSVRNRRPGDRFRPLGLEGHKKLQDFFVDRKVSRSLRDLVPIVVDKDDRIIWVAGHGIDDEFRVTDPAQAVIVLELKVLGGPA
jgi:tRNA(Ile)-lysidine synthase